MLVSVAGFNPPSDMPPADGRRADRNTVSKADPHTATRTLEAFLKKRICRNLVTSMLCAIFVCFMTAPFFKETVSAAGIESSIPISTDGSNHGGMITDDIEANYYRFTLPSSGRVTLTAIADMQKVYYRIYDENGNRIWSIEPEWNGTTRKNSAIETIDLVKGIYYFTVERHWWGGTGDYSFKLNFTSSDESFVDTQNEAESNNTIELASNILLDTSYKGQMALNESKDFYKFVLDSSGRVKLIANIEICVINYRIYDEVGDPLWSIEPVWNDTTRKSNINETIDLTKGTYYLVVERNWQGFTGNYTFQFTKYIEAPAITVTDKKSNGIRLEWESVPGAEGYYIYRKTGSGKWKKAKTTSATAWLDKEATTNGTRYQYRVYAYNGKAKSAGSDVRTTYYLTGVTLSSAKNTSNGTVTVKWKGVSSKASGYQVWYKTPEDNAYWYVNVPGKKANKTTIIGLQKGKTYEILVYAYKEVKDTKYHSVVSKAKRVKIKK